MCHVSCIIFGAKNLVKDEISGMDIIEIGSYDLNGSLRSLIESMKPGKYVGVDIIKGPSVDLICRAEDLVGTFGSESFDVVISNELLEHVRDWRKVISNIKNICKPNGIILITTRSYGFFYHGFPYDFWRYELEDMRDIFSDFEILVLEKDPELPGVFVKVRKPTKFVEKDLSNNQLYSVVMNKRVKNITDEYFWDFNFLHMVIKAKLRNLILDTINFLFSKI